MLGSEENSLPSAGAFLIQNSSSLPSYAKTDTNEDIYEDDSIELAVSHESPHIQKLKTQEYVEINLRLMFHSDRFRVRKYIGRGGEATVFIGEDTETGQIVALKQYEKPKEEY